MLCKGCSRNKEAKEDREAIRNNEEDDDTYVIEHDQTDQVETGNNKMENIELRD